MHAVLRNSWPLFLGLLLLMIGNGAQGALLGVRAVLEEISTETYGFISAGYFAGFLVSSTVTPHLIRKVGHVRVFAALGSLVSAAVIVFVWLVDPIVWLIMRVLIGFAFAGIYIVCESWLNEAVDNSQRGKALGLYTLVQMVGVVLGQQILNLGDPRSFELFIIISVLVSLSFAPILLTVTPAPISASAKRMTLKELYASSPLGCFGAFMLGGVMGSMFGMSAVYGARIELDNAEIAAFASAMYFGAVLIQPIVGWISDRMDRRVLIIVIAMISAVCCILAATLGRVSLGMLGGAEILALYPLALLVGGFVNPLYPLLAAHTNDFLEHDQMAAASSGLLFLNGIGAFIGPVVLGFAMTYAGDESFWLYMAALLVAMAGFGVYRATRRASVAVGETGRFAAISPRMTTYTTEMYQEAAAERSQAQDGEPPAEDGVAGAAPSTPN